MLGQAGPRVSQPMTEGERSDPGPGPGPGPGHRRMAWLPKGPAPGPLLNESHVVPFLKRDAQGGINSSYM